MSAITTTTAYSPTALEADEMVRHYEYDAYNRLLDDEGFLVWPKLLPAPLIDAHLAGLDAVMTQTAPGSTAPQAEAMAAVRRARARFHREHQPTLEMIFAPELVAFLRYRFGETPVMRQPQTGYYQQHTPAHTESLNIKPSDDREVRIWCALEDVDPTAGAVYYVPRSHRLIAATLEERLGREHPEFLQTLRALAAPTTLTEFGDRTGPFFRDVRHVELPRLIAESQSRKVAPILEKGDVVIFRSDVVHGTSACRDDARTRKYLTAFWAGRSTRWYHTRAWWGPHWDHRADENSFAAPVEDLSVGSRIEFSDYNRAYIESFARPVHVA